MTLGRLLSGVLLGLDLSSGASADPLKRALPISGRIVARKVGETAILQPSPVERNAEVRQDLKAGDVLRTHDLGTLAIAFIDRTQIRLGPRSVLVVKQVRAGVPSQLELQSGSLWGRAARGQAHLSINTAAASAGVRGTSWAIKVDGDQTALQVFDGAR